MASATPLEQAAVLVGKLGSILDITMPEKRPPDAMTLAHRRAAEWLHKAASWLLHGADLDIVTKRTPFTAETAQDLWQYYQSLPLDQRVDKLVVWFITVEMMQSCGILTREQFPRTRRLMDVYSGVLATTCVMPRRVFYYLHWAMWSIESFMAKRQVSEPAAPLPLSREAEEALNSAVQSAWSLIGGQPTSSTSPGSGRSTTSWMTVLLATSVGVGAVIWLAGADNVRGARRAAVDKWSRLQRTFGITPRFLQ
uniref:Uncharacterized protein n=1 Tax=Alexandrium monilatum TaxID=311494 RepID=A0A7S4RKY5_9DINO|mmetsp:Transcript_15977/g.48153  ORF Transcript_15977/g.48153 Transcript_15977/m.48153 type:complete len:253 (-) Transcript_15977:48-806(-)